MWNLIFGDDEDSLDPQDEGTKEEVENLKENVSKVETVPTHQFASVVKHRLPTPVRQAGDGMEEVLGSPLSTPEQPEQTTQLSKTSAEGKLKLSLSDIVLEKLPPISDGKVRMPEHVPKTPLVKINPAQPFRGESKGFHKSKDPKFVPYEPYKAAITPMVVTKKKRKICDQKRITKDSQSPSYSSDSCSLEKSQDHVEVCSNDESEKITILSQALLEEKDAEIARLKLKLVDSEKQLRIQTQVNTEVKKLLVASVGEDIEAKVDYLTQDKARLAADMRQFSNQISKDFEEKEKLSVQSDVWKSKFLACSLIVDELARWKSLLIQHQDDADHYIRLLFHERNVLWNSLVETKTVLEELRTAFDPLGIISNSSKDHNCPLGHDFEAASVLGMADFNQKVSMELRDRLLGETKIKALKESSFRPCLLDTPAEEGLREVLSSAVQSPPGFSELTSVAVTGAAKSHLLKMSDKLASPTSYKCCTHCQGNIQIV